MHSSRGGVQWTHPPPPPSENSNFLNSQGKVTKNKPWIWVYLTHEMLSYEVHVIMKVEIKKNTSW